MMDDFEIVNKDAEVNTYYGLETFYITKEDINALLSGKKLYSTVNCCEYAMTIEMAESEDKAKLAEMDCKDCKQEIKNEPPSAISKEDLSKVFMLGLAFGFGDKHDEMGAIKKSIEQTFKPVREIRAEVEKHCGLIKGDHCKFCSSCHCLMGVREILDILNKHGGL